MSLARGKRSLSESRSLWNVNSCEFRWRFGNAALSDVPQWRTAPPAPHFPHPRHRSHYFVARAFPPSQTTIWGTCSCPSPTPPVPPARGRHLGRQQRLRAKKHLERAGSMSRGRPVMSPLNVRRGARNIKCRPYRLALASHNLGRGQRVKAIHNSSARPPRSPQVMQHGGPFKAAWVQWLWLHVLWDYNAFIYIFCLTRHSKKDWAQMLLLQSFCLSVKGVYNSSQWKFQTICIQMVSFLCLLFRFMKLHIIFIHLWA